MSNKHIVLEPMNEGEPLKKGLDIGATRMEELEHKLNFIGHQIEISESRGGIRTHRNPNELPEHLITQLEISIHDNEFSKLHPAICTITNLEHKALIRSLSLSIIHGEDEPIMIKLELLLINNKIELPYCTIEDSLGTRKLLQATRGDHTQDISQLPKEILMGDIRIILLNITAMENSTS